MEGKRRVIESDGEGGGKENQPSTSKKKAKKYIDDDEEDDSISESLGDEEEEEEYDSNDEAAVDESISEDYDEAEAKSLSKLTRGKKTYKKRLNKEAVSNLPCTVCNVRKGTHTVYGMEDVCTPEGMFILHRYTRNNNKIPSDKSFRAKKGCMYAKKKILCIMTPGRTGNCAQCRLQLCYKAGLKWEDVGKLKRKIVPGNPEDDKDKNGTYPDPQCVSCSTAPLTLQQESFKWKIPGTEKEVELVPKTHFTCKTSNIVYGIVCIICHLLLYIGSSKYTLDKRSGEHFSFINKYLDLWKQIKETKDQLIITREPTTRERLSFELGLLLGKLETCNKYADMADHFVKHHHCTIKDSMRLLVLEKVEKGNPVRREEVKTGALKPLCNKTFNLSAVKSTVLEDHRAEVQGRLESAASSIKFRMNTLRERRLDLGLKKRELIEKVRPNASDEWDLFETVAEEEELFNLEYDFYERESEPTVELDLNCEDKEEEEEVIEISD